MITLTYDSTSIELPSPQLGNKDITTIEKINKRTRGGDTILFSDPDWPHQKEVKYDFDTLTLEQVTLLRNFVSSTLGLTVEFTDFEGNSFWGVINSPNFEIIQNSRNCDYSTSLSFLVVP